MLRIVSEDGVGAGTKFIDAETGKDVSDVVSVAFGATVTIGELVTARCELLMTAVDLAVHRAEFVTHHPISKDLQPVAAIEFRDGWRIDFLEDGTPRVRQTTPTGAI